MAASLTLTALQGFPMIEPGDDLVAIITDCLKAAEMPLRDGDIIAVAQKVVSKAEGRYVDLEDVTPSERAIELSEIVRKDPRHIEVVLRESREVVRTRQNVMIVEHRLGFVMANAGIDESNIPHADGESAVLLLPEDPDASCATLKRGLEAAFGCNIGVLMNDSFGRPWRNGVVGVAIGSAGLPSLYNRIGDPDLFGRPMKVTEIAIADELAAAASLMMGQADEGRPVVLIRGFKSSAPVNKVSALVRAREMDMFR